jgi:acetyl-CoA carboxylase beta subunit
VRLAAAMPVPRFSRLAAAERAATLLDPGTLEPLGSGGAERSTLLVARGRIGGRRAVLALTDGRLRGGTIGAGEARQLSHIAAEAERQRAAVVLCWDTGGVRVQEGPAALTAASTVGVALARLALTGVPVVHVVCGPRGCFGAPAVIAATGHRTIMLDGALWGLTGPQLLEGSRSETAARAAMTAACRCRNGHVDERIADRPAEVRGALVRFLHGRLARAGALRVLDRCLVTTGRLLGSLGPARRSLVNDVRTTGRQRDFFAYSFRRQWQPAGPTFRFAHVHAAWGMLGGQPAMATIVGPERSVRGIGVADAHAVLQAIRYAVATAPGAPIVTFLFCRGHASDLHEERAGLPRALGECLRGMVAARLAGHPLVCVLGGGAYGAAYLVFAAPSHRILAIRGTAIAPMAPRVLAAFQRLRGTRAAPETPADLAALIPEIRIVDSVVRLPRVLPEELEHARQAAGRTKSRARLALAG